MGDTRTSIALLAEQIQQIEESVGLLDMKEQLRLLQELKKREEAAERKREAKRKFERMLIAREGSEGAETPESVARWREESKLYAKQRRKERKERRKAVAARREIELAAKRRERAAEDKRKREAEDKKDREFLKSCYTLYDAKTLEEYPDTRQTCRTIANSPRTDEGACDVCGHKGFLNRYAGQLLCRDCMCADDPDSMRIELLQSNFGRTAIDYSATGKSGFRGLNAPWLSDRIEWAENVLRSLPYVFHIKEFRKLRDELLAWSNLHPRTEWRNARTMLMARFVGKKRMYKISRRRNAKGHLVFVKTRDGYPVEQIREKEEES